ncbi:MAG: flagellar biosynthesis protein FlhB [Vampirovibrionales bacterium]|nr:flagellar biosynthesis protein FlhB [Vampirovibrionales bacterium]
MADEDKQFEASAQKIQKAREEGQVFKSRDMSTAIVLVSTFGLLLLMTPMIWREISTLFILVFDQIPNAHIEDIGWQYLALISVKALVLLIAPFIVGAAIMATIADFFQVGPLFATKAVMPKFDKLNPVAGIKNMFSMRSLIELVKNILKIAVLGFVGWKVFEEYLGQLLSVGASENVFALMGVLGALLTKFILLAGLAFFIIGGADFLFQRWKFMQDQKMSFKEMKDEFKNSEGDPMVKHALRQRRMQMLQQSMLEAVPDADVVITNPIHLAVAIKYQAENMEAPQVVAKGAELFAEKIKNLAREYGVPIVREPEVARALYRIVDIDREVPPDIYQAVAEILLFAWKSVGKGVPGSSAPTGLGPDQNDLQ